MKKRILKNSALLLLIAFCLSLSAYSQTETPPAPSAPRNFSIPKPVEKTLPNGLRVIVVQTKNVPIVTAEFIAKSGGETDPANLYGLADFTASLMTKGTKTRSATQIAEEIEFLGGFIGSGAGWDQSSVSTRVTSDKIDKALGILSDVVRNPTFSQEEIDRYREQLLDSLTVQMTQPGSIAGYVSSRLIYGRLPYSHPISGTPESVKRIAKKDIEKLHKENYVPYDAILVFTGDITPLAAFNLAGKWFGKWVVKGSSGPGSRAMIGASGDPSTYKVKGITVVDLPNSGQAAVSFAKLSIARIHPDYYKANVLNSVLGGGYSSRLNQEVRIKRGLSYGANSNFTMRESGGSFRMSCQTKNESAAEVAELFITELERMAKADVPDTELVPRKSVLTGDFGRELATTGGLADIVGNLAVYELPLTDINSYIQSVNGVKSDEIKSFAAKNLSPNMGYIVIVGDYKLFSEDLKKRFGNTPMTVIPVDKLDLESPNLMKK